MSIDRVARLIVAGATAGYLRGTSKSFHFDDTLWEFNGPSDTSDVCVRQIAQRLWHFYDDIIDHPVRLSRGGWDLFRRTIAFLRTDLEVLGESRSDYWPFADEPTWRQHEHLVQELGLPDYDPVIHNRPIRDPREAWIPSWLGFLIIFGLLAIFFAIILNS